MMILTALPFITLLFGKVRSTLCSFCKTVTKNDSNNCCDKVE